jgi:predicted secreted hydrolase
MKLSLLLVLSALSPSYRYQFPADHFNHPAFQTEWWYYTGNLHDATGHRYGFELTFFRQAIHLPKTALDSTGPIWRPDQLYLAHLALTDIDGHAFFHTERLSRAGPGLAGADIGARKYWNGNWQVYWKNLESGEQQLQAVCDRFTLTLELTPLKPAVIHGANGISQKGSAPGEASHYLSFTRLSATGRLDQRQLTGLAWMDHEFFTQPPNPTVAGWDWFAIQLANNEELMLYRLRTKTGEISPYSSGTYIDSSGAAHNLTAGQIVLTPGRMWRKYPVEWRIAIPSLSLQLNERTEVDNQELATPSSPSPSYWEGAVTYGGSIHGKPVDGLGYLEMTSYSQPIRLGH